MPLGVFIIHLIFSSRQIGRFGISQREFWVSGRFLRGKNISYFCQKLALLTLLKTNFLGFFCAILLLCNCLVELPLYQRLDGWMDDAIFVLFNSISVISGQCLDDNERLCGMELRL